ncbi:MAG TPA: hypothetical protein VE153_16255, partial [Myxococcus sp.]|nr:hypothetical protein [Myxococcus sp.]
ATAAAGSVAPAGAAPAAGTAPTVGSTPPDGTAPVAGSTAAAGTPGTVATATAPGVEAPGTPSSTVATQPSGAVAQNGTSPRTEETGPGTRPRSRARRGGEAMDPGASEEPRDPGNATTLNALQQRIEDLEQEVSNLAVAGKLDEAKTETAQRMLDKYRAQANRANAAQRQKISAGLDYFERIYLK